MPLAFAFSIVFSRMFHLTALYLVKPGINKITFSYALILYVLPCFVFNEYYEMRRGYANKLEVRHINFDRAVILSILLMTTIFYILLPEPIGWSHEETFYLKTYEYERCCYST